VRCGGRCSGVVCHVDDHVFLPTDEFATAAPQEDVAKVYRVDASLAGQANCWSSSTAATSSSRSTQLKPSRARSRTGRLPTNWECVPSTGTRRASAEVGLNL
jgi:hypothetical protein